MFTRSALFRNPFFKSTPEYVQLLKACMYALNRRVTQFKEHADASITNGKAFHTARPKQAFKQVSWKEVGTNS